MVSTPQLADVAVPVRQSEIPTADLDSSSWPTFQLRSTRSTTELSCAPTLQKYSRSSPTSSIVRKYVRLSCAPGSTNAQLDVCGLTRVLVSIAFRIVFVYTDDSVCAWLRNTIRASIHLHMRLMPTNRHCRESVRRRAAAASILNMLGRNRLLDAAKSTANVSTDNTRSSS